MDWISPQSMDFSKDCFKINERFGRVLYMQDYASYVKDDMISELCELSGLDQSPVHGLFQRLLQDQ